MDGLVLLISFWGNLYILIVNGFDWMKVKRLKLADKLTFGVSLFEALYEFLKAYGYVSEMLRSQKDLMTSILVTLTIMSCNLWLSTCLCVKFCLTIVNCKNGFFTYLQKRSARNILWLLVSSLMTSFLLIVLWANSAIRTIRTSVSNTSLVILNQNVSEVPKLFEEFMYSAEAYISVSSLGFLMSSASLLTTICSLSRHMKRVKINVHSFRSPTTDVHMRAVRTLFFTFLSHSLFFTAILLTVLKSTEGLWIPYISILTSLCNALSAITTIKGNSRLVRPLDKLFRCLPHGTTT
ncbi:taste receptor type 2 member 9-like [Leptodactylus fuscus]|uniref:taste receptor type 2 member 9-like n=1 Tax=Leptodactylus fuscus TaxID=238119 RepID=UPI003F4EB42E